MMERNDRIIRHKDFIYNLNENILAEADRRFCRHNIVHFLDVARIGEIMNLEENLGIQKEIIYAAALLHDLGRHVQYRNKTPHEIAGGQIAEGILKECGFDEAETKLIVDAIVHHRDASVSGEKSLRGILYRADKASRACFFCEAKDECDWKNAKKNMSIKY